MVALKEVKINDTCNKNDLIREANILSSCDHENIVKLLFESKLQAILSSSELNQITILEHKEETDDNYSSSLIIDVSI